MSHERLIHQDGKVKSIMEGLIGMRELKLWSKKKSFLETFNFHNNKIANISVSTQLRNTLVPHLRFYANNFECFFDFFNFK